MTENGTKFQDDQILRQYLSYFNICVLTSEYQEARHDRQHPHPGRRHAPQRGLGQQAGLLGEMMMIMMMIIMMMMMIILMIMMCH